MKAVYFENHGELDVLKYGDLPDPEETPGHAIVKVKAVALNHLDIWVRKGWSGLNLDLPHIGGSDISGEVVSVNGANTNLSKGDRVIVNPGINTIQDKWTRNGEGSVSPGYKIIGEQLKGGMAEYVSVPVQNLFKIPDGISFAEAAAPILVGMTAWRMLVKRAELQAGQTVLIVGAGGGVNSISIALATAMGAEVFALTSNEDKMLKAQSLGAKHVINYKDNPKWAVEILKLTKGNGVDVVVDNVGVATFDQSIRAVARGGKIVTVGNTSGFNISFDNRFIFSKQISLIGSTMGSAQDFIDVMEFIWSQNIPPIIDRVESLKDGIDMFKYLEKGEQFGKIILEPR
ncbi:MAG: zinc-binding dehydrogenase [Deltaproteobacteria bacterium]|nr:zinc-binding dehydrogenase [Deltaproteobacteria bacterium]